MSLDLYLYNGTNQNIDTTASIDDLAARRGALVPPGSQAHVQVADQPAYDAFVAQQGAVSHASVNPNTVSVVTHSSVPVVAKGAVPPIIIAPPPVPPPVIVSRPVVKKK